MKNCKFFLLIIACALSLFNANAQKEIPDSTELLFDANGSFTRVENTPEEVKAKMVSINPLIDDVIWRKVVLRVIDLREQVNQPLYYPYENLSDFSQKNLFSIMFYNLLEGNLVGYKDQRDNKRTLVPEFTANNIVDLENATFVTAPNMQDKTTWQKVEQLTQGVIQYYIQEIWYFNKTTSTFHNKIVAIAPVYNETYNTRGDPEIHTGIWFWIPFDKLRPFLQKEFMKLSGRNLAPTVNFDDFLMERKFAGYVIKDYGIDGKDVAPGANDPVYIRQEQDRIENEILNFEQDLWQY